MAEKTSAVLVSALNELMDSCNKKPTCAKTREWVKRREQSGYFNNIVKELKVEDRLGFREMFRMDVRDFEFILLPVLNWFQCLLKHHHLTKNGLKLP